MDLCFDLCFFVITNILIIHFYGLTTTTTAKPGRIYHFCQGGNYTANSTFRANLNLLLPSLSSTNITLLRNGYHNTTVGRNPDTVYGSFQCSGDATPEVCEDCVDTAVQEIIRNETCPLSKQVFIWYDACWFRYSDEYYFSIRQESPKAYLWPIANISDPVQFNKILAGLLDDLVKKAASSNTFKFDYGETSFTEFQKIYGLVMCTSDLTSTDCTRCLRGAISQIPTCCDGKQGGNVIQPSCKIRYEIYPFSEYNSRVSAPPTPSPLLRPPPIMPPPPSTNTTTTNSTGNNSSRVAVGVAVPLVIVLLSTITIWWFCFHKKKAKNIVDDVDEIRSAESLQFNFNTISSATENFSDANKLGEGGFGSVYKGTLLDGEQIAVKRLSENSGQGEQEFKNEVVLVARLQHRNLVRLLGFCIHGQEKLLVYEFMPNASLDQFIFDPIKRTYLDWERRYKIIGGIARGLLYLHEDSRLKIIHRDLKASNILLDVDMNCKISDFGMARLIVLDQTHANTNRIVGTFGYMAPEYAMQGHFSVKSDVFSFGVLVLEILSGQKNSSFYESEVAQDLLGYAWRHWKNGTPLELLDPTLRDSCSRSEVMRCIQIGLLCVQENIADRPTMASIILMLNSYSVSLPLPLPPAFFVHTREEPTIHSDVSEEQAIVSNQSRRSATWTVNEVSITELDPR